jgi:OmpA-OmpF porin, OOP family
MRSRLVVALLVGVGLAGGCATSNAGKVCSATASWQSPATRCVPSAPPPSPVAVAEPAPAPPPPPPSPPPRRAEVKGGKIELKETVDFKTGSAELLHSSDALLDEVVQIMKQHVDITKIRIEGHTDNRGVKAHNQKLSQGRAASVKSYLAAHGVDAGRMTTKGYGQDRPIADNGTEAGRAQNRRVEIHIDERK